MDERPPQPIEPLAPTEPAPSAEPDRFAAGDLVLFVGRRQREYMVRLTPGRRVKVKGEFLDADEIIGLPVGTSLVTPIRSAYLALRPTLAQRIMNMERQAQIIYPKDLAAMLSEADVRPGARIIEVGTGHGAMTMSLVRAVGDKGRVVSYEIRADHARQTRHNLRRFVGEAEWWEVKVANPAQAGFDERDFDAAIIDMPSPWELAANLVPALRGGAPAVFLLPTVPQVVKLVEALRETGKFAHVQTFELLKRFWNVDGPSVRPEMRMSAHTAFLISARRKLGEVVRLTKGGLLA
jgi:tRNA (adenine57-N1/adenine58-N1)-methyltransferase